MNVSIDLPSFSTFCRRLQYFYKYFYLFLICVKSHLALRGAAVSHDEQTRIASATRMSYVKIRRRIDSNASTGKRAFVPEVFT